MRFLDLKIIGRQFSRVTKFGWLIFTFNLFVLTFGLMPETASSHTFHTSLTRIDYNAKEKICGSFNSDFCSRYCFYFRKKNK